MFSIIPFLCVLGVLVFIHEWGHYFVARMWRVPVQAFSIGMGPEVMGYTAPSGTRWKWCLIPLGGYVAIADDDLNKKSAFIRVFIAAAGPLMNYLFAIIALVIAHSMLGIPAGWPVIDKFTVGQNRATTYQTMHQYDRITHIDGCPVHDIETAQSMLNTSSDHTLELRKNYTGKSYTVQWSKDNKMQIIFKNTPHRIAFMRAVQLSLWQTWFFTHQVFLMLKNMIVKLSAKNLGGPISIAKYSEMAWSQGWYMLMIFMASLSVSLGFINLLPVPVLDGGRIFMGMYEGIVGRSISNKATKFLMVIGISIVILLLVTALFQDIKRINWIMNIVENLQQRFGWSHYFS